MRDVIVHLIRGINTYATFFFVMSTWTLTGIHAQAQNACGDQVAGAEEAAAFYRNLAELAKTTVDEKDAALRYCQATGFQTPAPNAPALTQFNAAEKRLRDAIDDLESLPSEIEMRR